MTERATFSLDADNLTFLNIVGGNNRSAYINELLEREKQIYLENMLLKANKQEAEDAEYKKELSVWDETISDGL
ncbi:MAG: hypothetical protein R3D71_06330 [Rickettsiales bacterium]